MQDTDNKAKCNDTRQNAQRPVMCGFYHAGANVPATNVFKTATGAECYCCEQHTNIALTCMTHLRKLNT